MKKESDGMRRESDGVKRESDGLTRHRRGEGDGPVPECSRLSCSASFSPLRIDEWMDRWMDGWMYG